MENDEKYIEGRFGRRQCFKVPDGYLDGLADHIMSGLADQPATVQHPAAARVAIGKAARWRFAAAAAASVLVAMTAGLAMTNSEQPRQAAKPVAATLAASPSAQTAAVVNQMADYAMIDNEEMYAYISGN